jgi:hypothetical protein
MDANAIIEDYVNNVAAKLPGRLRNDIGLELRTLLTDQLRSAAEEAGRAADAEMALEVLRQFGRPDEVASRYVTPGFELIEPGYAPTFVKLAAACVAIQWAITLPLVFYSRMTFPDWWLHWGFSAFAWVGALVIWFAVGSWNRRRAAGAQGSGASLLNLVFWLPGGGEWRPGEPQAAERRAARNAAPLGAVLTVFFIAPAWILGHLLPAGTNTSWAVYDAHFQGALLPPLIALMVVRLLLQAAVTVNARWRAPTETIRFGLRLVFVALLFWVVFAWHIFAFAFTDAVFKAWLLIFLLVNSIQMIVWMRRASIQVRVPKHLAPPK